MAPQAYIDLGGIPNPSGGMMSSRNRRIAFRTRWIGWQIGVWNNITTFEEFMVAKDSPGQYLFDANDAEILR
jgi:hypothetical protein